jgi:Glycosyltransferase
MARLKILVVGDPASIHTNRFVGLLQEIGYDVRVFQSEIWYNQEEHLRGVVLYTAFPDEPPRNGNTLRICYPFEVNCNAFMQLLGRYPLGLKLFCKTVAKLIGRRPRVNDLIHVVKKWQPAIVFSLKMQNDGYLVSLAKQLMGKNFTPKWVHFNWGTDIEFFGKHQDYAAEHLPKIMQLLSLCDYHIADCQRDARQAVTFGFKGESLGTCLAHGGFDLAYLEKIRDENSGKRDIILIKGRQGGYVGKAFNVLAALHKIPDLLRGYKIKIMMPSTDVKGVAAFLKQIDGIDYEIVSKLPYRELLALFAQSKIAVAASDVDGTPSFLVEAMAMGAFPIHSDMESIREWVQDGVNGLLFPVNDIPALNACITKALNDEDMLIKAQKVNWDITKHRMDRSRLRDHIKALIEGKVLKSRQ